MNKRLIQIMPSIILYTFAGLLIIYTIWSFVCCGDIITEAKAAGQLAASGNEHDIISFYMDNCGQYFVFSLLLTAAGFILLKKQPSLTEYEAAPLASKYDAADDELEEWYDELERRNDVT
jgi:hypothetical protein